MIQRTTQFSYGEYYGYKDCPPIYRCRNCNNNLSSNDPASQYQRQKIIQNTVRVPASLFTMNLGALNAYERPNLDYKMVDISGSNYIVSPGVNWNQMSDRKEPHIQVAITGTGSGYHSSSTRRTITGPRPGAMSPGGSGVDIKHNSYDRYLNRLKGKAPLRRGVIPPDYGIPYIPFSRAYPIYGGKTIKTSIVNRCNCPIDSDVNSIYKNSDIQENIYSVKFTFHVGDYVYAIKIVENCFCGQKYKAQIISIDGDIYLVKFEDGTTEYVTEDYLSIYFDCSGCVNPDNSDKPLDYTVSSEIGGAICNMVTSLANGQLL